MNNPPQPMEKKQKGGCGACMLKFMKKITRDKIIALDLKQSITCNFVLSKSLPSYFKSLTLSSSARAPHFLHDH
jgi:hypothetical protein